MKNKFVVLVASVFSLLFLLGVFRFADDITNVEKEMLKSPNVIDVTGKIHTKVLVSGEELKSGWAKSEFDDHDWEETPLPHTAMVSNKAYIEGNFAFYRILVPQSEVQKLAHLVNEIYLGLQYVDYSYLEVYVNGVFFRANSPTNSNETILNVPLRGDQSNLIGLKGRIKTGNTGINHRNKILLGKGAELNELHRKAYKGMTVFSLIFLLCKGSVLFVFTLIYLVVNVERSFEKFLAFGFCVFMEDILTGDYLAAYLNLNQMVFLYELVNIGAVIFLILFFSDVIRKELAHKIFYCILGLLGIISVVFFVEVLYTNYIFNIDHMLQFWNFAMAAVLIYYGSQIFKVDKVLSIIMAVAFCMNVWSSFFASNVGLNFKAFGNLLMFFMVAYQTFILFRREQNLLQEKQRQLMEQEKDVAIGRTASVLAHDVRRPLEQMNLILGRLGSKDVTPEFLTIAKRDVEFAIAAVTNQINDILSYTKNKQIDHTPTSFYKSLEGSLRQVMTVNAQMDIALEYDFRGLVQVLSEESQLSGVLLNLVSNAVEAIRDIGKSQKGIIRLSTVQEENEFVFKIYNDGPHIPEDIIGEIFKPLITHGKSKGTGLGLASVFKTIQEHRGSISVRNVHPSGVEFTVIFKASQVSEQIPTGRFLHNSRGYSYSGDERKIEVSKRMLRVLLVDNESNFYDYFLTLVKQLPFDVQLTHAVDYENAREVVLTKRFDLYVLDYDLGGAKKAVDFYRENLYFLSEEVIVHTNMEQPSFENISCVCHSEPISFQDLSELCEKVYKSRLKILLVDDSKFTRVAWEMFHGKHNVYCVGSPEEALKFIEEGKHEVGLCVLDYYYDNSSVTGEVLASKIKEINPCMKIVLSSSVEMTVEGIECISKRNFEVRNLSTNRLNSNDLEKC